jgi:hypothetical protein
MARVGLHHVDIVVSDLERSVAFLLPGYYASFFHDPDGLKLEVVFVP